MWIAVPGYTHVEEQQAIAQPDPVHRPEPVRALFRYERGGFAGATAGIEMDGGVRGIVAGFDGHAVVDERGLAAGLAGFGSDERVAEEPKNAAVAKIDGKSPVAARPERIGTEQTVGLRPGSRTAGWSRLAKGRSRAKQKRKNANAGAKTRRKRLHRHSSSIFRLFAACNECVPVPP
ncbi:MAG TPA: hypothetical protein VMA34_09335 [Terracidiphilus sp.]|nr:hypothetical protein [Terracidiphilus sp.]